MRKQNAQAALPLPFFAAHSLRVSFAPPSSSSFALGTPILSLLDGVSWSKATLPLEVSVLTTSSRDLHVPVQIRISTVVSFVSGSSADPSTLTCSKSKAACSTPGVAIILPVLAPALEEELVSSLSLSLSGDMQLNFNLCAKTSAFCLLIYSPVLCTPLLTSLALNQFLEFLVLIRFHTRHLFVPKREISEKGRKKQ